MSGSPTGSMFVMSLTDSVRWVVFNVGVALLPIWATKIISVVFRKTLTWPQLLKDGEMFVFASTLSASAMSTAFFERNVGEAGIMLAGCALVIVLMISTGLFFATVQLKVSGEPLPDEKMAARVSTACAVAASVLSYVVHAAGSIR